MLNSAETGEDADGAALARLGEECRLAAAEREVLLLRLSLLPAQAFRPHYGRLAESALEPLGRADRARLYRLPRHDLALAWRGDAATLEQQTLATLRTLFSDAAPAPPFAALVRRFRLPADSALLHGCLPIPTEPASAAPRHPPLDLAELAAIERALASADVARFARRRPVGRRDTEGGFQLAWEKRLLSLAEIAATLAPGRDLAADPFLFRRLTRTLDARMLALLASPGELAATAPFSIALAVESILSPAFLHLDAALPAPLRGKVLLELAPADIFADTAAFLFARDFARARGFRLVLSNLIAASLPALPLARLGLDFLELRFSPPLADLAPEALAEAAPDSKQIILSGADHPAALAWGEARGIALFAGRLVVPEMDGRAA